MSHVSNSSTADSVHQANLATFRSYRKTIDELYNKPYTLLGDHASLVRRLQDWRKAVAHLTVWVADDRAYYQQARPEIVNLLEASKASQARKSASHSHAHRRLSTPFEL
jgi:hypothetical protein